MGKKAPKKAPVEPGTVPGQSASAMLMNLGKEGFIAYLLTAKRSDLDRYVLGLTGKAPHKTRTDAQVIAALSRWAEGEKNWTADPPPPESTNKLPKEKGKEKTGAKPKKTGEKKPRKPGVCAFIAERLKAKEDTGTILEGIRKNFPDSKATSKDVSIIRSKVNQGLM